MLLHHQCEKTWHEKKSCDDKKKTDYDHLNLKWQGKKLATFPSCIIMQTDVINILCETSSTSWCTLPALNLKRRINSLRCQDGIQRESPWKNQSQQLWHKLSLILWTELKFRFLVCFSRNVLLCDVHVEFQQLGGGFPEGSRSASFTDFKQQ